MTTILIIVLFIAVAWLTIALISYTSQQSKDIEYLKARDKSLRKAFNTSADRQNEHLRAFQELADLQGYCVHQTHEVKFNLASVFGHEEPQHIKKLVVHKKNHGKDFEAEPMNTVAVDPLATTGQARPVLEEPTEEDLRSPLFEAIWQAIKGWDIERYRGAGRAGATGTDVKTILNTLKRYGAVPETKVEKKKPAKRRK